MDHSSPQVGGVVEQYVSHIDGPPSSPFVTEVAGTKSRCTSDQFNDRPLSCDIAIEDLDALPSLPSSGKNSPVGGRMSLDDKENVPSMQSNPTGTPTKTNGIQSDLLSLSTPGKSTPLEGRRGSADSDLMPPPSTRKTPKRSPLKPSKNLANTPGPLSRGNSFEKAELSSNFPTYSPQKQVDTQLQEEATGIDDTCFSHFSEIPDLTQWARATQSPSKRLDDIGKLRTPGRESTRTPRTTHKRSFHSRSPSPTPRRLKTPGLNPDGTQTFLIDFTQQIEGLAPSRTEPNLLSYLNGQRSPARSTRQSLATPAKQNNILSLLDFELPPAPTPRSMPTVTARELETLKSSYLSQISSLKATLSGREAEVESLKRAVGDAERRVGEAQEALREEKGRREHVEQEKRDWEKRGAEVESVLRNVKDEVLRGESEKEELLRNVEDSEQRAEDAEARATKAEERLAEALAAGVDGGDDVREKMEEQVQRLVSAQIDAKIEAVSRELHAVYKDKHERKVATLKKSYEARSEKRCADLQARVTELEKSNDELLADKDATFSGTLLEATSGHDVELKAQMEKQKAHLARIEEELYTSRAQHDELVLALEQERIEKGDLVAAVDEMLALQTEQGPTQAAMSVVEDFRKSISRPPSALSGLKPPGESRIGRSGGSARAPAFGKSKMLANIERMGRTVSHE